jgi:hypothetical protein
MRQSGTYVVEVGVNIGSLSDYLLRSRTDLVLFGVDVWENMVPSDEYQATGDTLAKMEREQLIKNKMIARGRTEKYGERCKLIQCDSVLAAGIFHNDALDMVFVDADHSYKAAKSDILAWLPKVKRGGYIGGHDYGVDGYGVKQAVDELEDARVLFPVELGANTTWFSRR